MRPFDPEKVGTLERFMAEEERGNPQRHGRCQQPLKQSRYELFTHGFEIMQVLFELRK